MKLIIDFDSDSEFCLDDICNLVQNMRLIDDDVTQYYKEIHDNGDRIEFEVLGKEELQILKRFFCAAYPCIWKMEVKE